MVIPHISEHAYAAAAALRAAGLDAEVLPPPDHETILMGEEHSHGRECHPWVVMSGELIRWATSDNARRGDVFYYPQTDNPCLISQYGDGHRRLLERIGVDHVDVWGIGAAELVPFIGADGGLRMYEGFSAIDLLVSAACARRPYERDLGAVDRALHRSVMLVCEAVEQKERTLEAVRVGMAMILDVPVQPGPRNRPLVGVCGDFYTRINPNANGDLFHRLERLGCQVWPHPYLGGLVDLGSFRHGHRYARRGVFGLTMLEGILYAATAALTRPLNAAVPAEIRSVCVEPDPKAMARLAEGHVGPRTNNLVVENVAKVIHYARNGAHGVINAVGVGCMVGVVTDGMIRALRGEIDIPLVTLTYSATESPSERIAMETFVHQVHERARA